MSDLTSLPKGSLNAVNAPASPAISIVSIFIVLELWEGFPSLVDYSSMSSISPSWILSRVSVSIDQYFLALRRFALQKKR